MTFLFYGLPAATSDLTQIRASTKCALRARQDSGVQGIVAIKLLKDFSQDPSCNGIHGIPRLRTIDGNDRNIPVAFHKH
jgi:hypothetical protein